MSDDDKPGRPRFTARGREIVVHDGDDDGGGPLTHADLFGAYALPTLPEAPAPRRATADAFSEDERLAYVDQLYRLLFDEEQIAELCARYFRTGRHTVKADLRKITKKYVEAERDPETIISRKARMRATMETFYRHALAMGDRASARYMLDRLAKIDGSYAPVKIETTSTQQSSLSLEAVIAACESDEELAAFEKVVAAMERAKATQQASPELAIAAIDVKVDDDR